MKPVSDSQQMIHYYHRIKDFDHVVQIYLSLITVSIIIYEICVISFILNNLYILAPGISPWESRRIKQELFDARAQIASLEERNKILFNHKKESYLLFEKEKTALEYNLNKSRQMVCKIACINEAKNRC